MNKTKLCKKCNKRKALSSFHKNSKAKDGLQYSCKVCNNKNATAWQKKNPDYWEKQKLRDERIKIQRRMRSYDLTYEEAKLLLETTHCEICKKELGSTGNVDHDHATGKVRGMLCGPCNRGLGIFQDDVARLETAINYLKTHMPL